MAHVKKRQRPVLDENGNKIWEPDPKTGKRKLKTEDYRDSKGRVRWDAQVYVGRAANGRPRFTMQTFDTRKEADAWARSQEKIKDDGGKPSTTKETLAEYMADWIRKKQTLKHRARGSKKGPLSQRTIEGYTDIVHRWIAPPEGKSLPKGCPRIGGIRLKKLSDKAFDELYVFMAEQGLSPTTIRHVHVVLHMALKDAVKKRLIGGNPTELATLPAARSKDEDADDWDDDIAKAMERDQARAFLTSAKLDRYSALWHVQLTGGLRPAEAFGLKWTDVDFEKGTVRIQRNLARPKGGGWNLTKVKTKRSKRTVPLPDMTMNELAAWRTQCKRERLAAGAEYENDKNLVFVTPFGQAMDLSNLYNFHFRKVCERAGLGEYGAQPEKPKGRPGPRRKAKFLPAFRIYDLRHTCATLLLLDGVPLHDVSRRLGHHSIQLTHDKYSHVLPDHEPGVAAAKRFDSMFG